MSRQIIAFEKAITIEDARLIYKWRSDPRTTIYWANQNKIEWDEHFLWFKNVLVDENELVLFSLLDGKRVGVIRLSHFVLSESAFSEVGIYLDPDLQGHGLGRKILSALPQWCFNLTSVSIDYIVARVSKDNVASLKSFIAAGFERLPIEIAGNMSVIDLLKYVAFYVNTGNVEVDTMTQEAKSHQVYIYKLVKIRNI